MKANVFVYLTNGNVVRMCVQHPAVGSCENGNKVGIFDHLSYRCAVDDYDDWYEDVAIYLITEVACIYVNNKCAWYNPKYIKASTPVHTTYNNLDSRL